MPRANGTGHFTLKLPTHSAQTTKFCIGVRPVILADALQGYFPDGCNNQRNLLHLHG